MKAFMLFTGSGPLVVLTSHGSITAPGLLEKFAAKDIDELIAREIRPAPGGGGRHRGDPRSARER